MVIIQAVVILFFLIRVYVKLSAAGRFRLEDWSCLLGWIFIVLLNGTVFFKLQFGEGFHIWEITETNFIELQKWLYISSLLYTPAAFFTKVAILLLVVRVFSVDVIVARVLHGVLAVFLIYHFPAQVAKTLVCLPVQAFWDPTVRDFKCINQTKLFIYNTWLGIVSGLTILLVPMILMWTLRVSLFKKIKIVGLLGAGGVAVGVTAYRMHLVLLFEDTKDPTVDFVPLDWTVTGELAIGLVCACFPSINYLIEQRNVNRPSANTPRTSSSSWRVSANKYFATISSWCESCGTKWGGTSGRSWFWSTGTRTVDSTARLAVTPDTERGEPQLADYDIELGVISRRTTDETVTAAPAPAPAPGGVLGGANEGWLAPLPALSPLPNIGRNSNSPERNANGPG